MNDVIAMRRQPSPTPVLCWLRMVEGFVKRIAADETARESAPKTIAMISEGGTVRRMIEVMRVRTIVTAPAASVTLTSAGDEISGDTTG